MMLREHAIFFLEIYFVNKNVEIDMHNKSYESYFQFLPWVAYIVFFRIRKRFARKNGSRLFSSFYRFIKLLLEWK